MLLHFVLSLVLKMKTWMTDLDDFVDGKFAEWTAYRSPKRRSVRLCGPEDLEARDCPSSTTWISHGPGNWSNPSNWDNGVPTSGMTAVFDPNKSYYNCTIDVNTANVNVTLQNGYTAQFFVNPGITWNMENFQDNDPGQDSFTVQYRTSGSLGGNLTINGNAKFYNMGISDSYSNAPAGSTTIASTATVIMGDGSGYNIQVADEIDDNGTWYIGAYSGGEASTVFANDAVSKPWVNKGSITINGSTSANYKDIVSAGYTYINNLSGNITFYGGAGQEIDMPFVQYGGNVSVDTGEWTFKGTLSNAFRQTYTDTILFEGGTFNLGEPITNAHNAGVYYDQSLEMDGSSTINIWGPNNVSNSDYLVGTSPTSKNYFIYGTINFNGYGQTLTVGTTQIGGGNDANGITITMYENAGTNKTGDYIVSTNTYGSGDIVLGGDSTLNGKVAAGDTAASGTFVLINELAGADRMQADFTNISLVPLTATHTRLSNANQSFDWTYTVP